MSHTWTERRIGNRLMVYRDGLPYVYVAKARAIPHGDGLFAARMFPKNATIAMYDGIEIADYNGQNEYVACIQRKGCPFVFVDGEKMGPPYAQKINDAVRTPYKNNARMKGSGKIIATRTLIKDDEILMSYGRSYWTHHSKRLR